MDIFKYFLDYLYSNGLEYSVKNVPESGRVVKLDNHYSVYMEDVNPFGEYVYYDCEVGRRIFTDLGEFQNFLKNKKY